MKNRTKYKELASWMIQPARAVGMAAATNVRLMTQRAPYLSFRGPIIMRVTADDATAKQEEVQISSCVNCKVYAISLRSGVIENHKKNATKKDIHDM